MTKMNLKIEHQVPGRVRMKIPAGKGNAELLKQISDVFAVIPGHRRDCYQSDDWQRRTPLRRRPARRISRLVPAAL